LDITFTRRVLFEDSITTFAVKAEKTVEFSVKFTLQLANICTVRIQVWRVSEWATLLGHRAGVVVFTYFKRAARFMVT
jgi:hypothetical protein